MRLLLDTHLLLWAAGDSRRLSADARALIGDSANELIFGAASLWEIVVKRSLGILVAQANIEGITLLTSDAIVARYPGPVRRV